MMGTLVRATMGVNALIFATLTVLLLWAAVKAPSRRLRNLALLCSAFVAVPTVGTLLGVLGLLTRGATEPFLEPPSLLPTRLLIVYGLVLISLAIVAMFALPPMVRTMAAQTVMLEVLSSRLDTEKLATLRLTPREVEVLEIMARGALEDEDLASQLSIAPSTAATHVRNIMHKAGVKDRRDLLLLRLG